MVTVGPAEVPTVNGRKELTLAVLGGAVAAGLALYLSGRGWRVHTQPLPAPLPPKTVTHTGSSTAPWLTPASWAALAGCGALLATRRWSRGLVAALIALAGLAVLAGGLIGVVEGGRIYLPLIVVLCGLGLTAVGGVAVLRGNAWPAMGSRYERAPEPVTEASDRPGDIWASLDRGEDPTA
jgi:hypothetical protein